MSTSPTVETLAIAGRPSLILWMVKKKERKKDGGYSDFSPSQCRLSLQAESSLTHHVRRESSMETGFCLTFCTHKTFGIARLIIDR